MDAIKDNLYPKRAFIPNRSPPRNKDPDYLLIQSEPPVKVPGGQDLLGDEIIEERMDEDDSKQEENHTDGLNTLRKNKLKGIKTTMKIVDTYT